MRICSTHCAIEACAFAASGSIALSTIRIIHNRHLPAHSDEVLYGPSETLPGYLARNLLHLSVDSDSAKLRADSGEVCNYQNRSSQNPQFLFLLGRIT